MTRGAAATTATAAQPQSSTRTPRRVPSFKEDDRSVLVMIRQPDTQPISQEQLIAEVKGIYAGLVMVESKCIEVVAARNAQGASTRIGDEQWQALIGLHRTLLYEHHDFFLASQHPFASPALRRLPLKYAMPARMWRHGIHAFLELLRNRLPDALEHMLAFIYLAYAAMALLYETVPAFRDTWVECLGDLSRYRMAIEDEDIYDREIWTGVSRYWYSRASDTAPTTGRLHHHLAILAKPHAMRQLFYYTKSLCVPIPFRSSRDSIMTLFNPVLNGEPGRLQPVELSFVKAHAMLFIATNTDESAKPLPKPLKELMSDYAQYKAAFLSELDRHIARTGRLWLEHGAFTAISNSNSLLEYGKTDSNKAGMGNIILSAINPQVVLVPNVPANCRLVLAPGVSIVQNIPSRFFLLASELNNDCDSLIFRRYGDLSTLSYLNIRLSFMNFMAGKEAAIKFLERRFPWTILCRMLNSLTHEFQQYDRIESKEFPRPSERKPNERPLPEDWSLRGHLWTDSLFPSDWFSSDKVDYDERALELPSMTEIRLERVLWLAWNLASHGRWIYYDEQKQFQVTTEFYQEAMDIPAEETDLTEVDDASSGVSTVDSVATTATADVDSVSGLKSSADGSDADDSWIEAGRSD